MDGVVGAGVLGAELVAGEAEEFDVVGVGGLQFCEKREVSEGLQKERVRVQKEEKRQEMSHTLVQLLKAFELRGEATLAGSVDNENDLALELGQIINIALLCALLSVSLSHTTMATFASNVLSRGLNSWKLVAEDMFAGDDTVAFLKLKKDLVAVLIY